MTLIRIETGGGVSGRSPAVSQIALEPSLVVEAGQALRITLYNSVPGVVVRLSGLIFDGAETKSFEETYTPTADRLANVYFSPLIAGALKNIRLAVRTGAVRRGQCFGVVEAATSAALAAPVLQILLSGYITSGAGISFPGSPIEKPQDGAGCVRMIQSPAPGAGLGHVVTVPANCRWWIKAAMTFYTTGPGAGRYLEAHAVDPGGADTVVSETVVPVAATAYRIALFDFGTENSPIHALGAFTALEVELYGKIVLTGGQTFQLIGAILPVDVFLALSLLLEEWIDF